MANAPKMQNINGSANSYLKAVSKKDASSALVNSAVKSAPKEQLQLILNILAAIHALFSESDSYLLQLDSRSTDVVLGRIASLLETYKLASLNEDLASAKDSILEAIDSISSDSALKALLASSIAELFDDDAKKEDIENLKAELRDLISSKDSNDKSSNAVNEVKIANEETKENANEENIKDEKVDDYQDSTIALNFSKLHNAIQEQFDKLNDNLKSIPGQSGLFTKIGKMMKNGFSSIANTTKKLTAGITNLTKNTFSKITNISKVLAGGAIAGISKTLKGITGTIGAIGKGIAGIGGFVKKGFSAIGDGIKGFGSKIGGFIASPFKKIGGFFKRKKKDPKEAKKESLREKFMNKMTAMMEKLWDFLEPILNKLKIFMLIAIVPILTTALTVLAIIAAITLIIIGIVMAVMWVKNKLIPRIKAIVKNAIAKIKAWWGKLKGWVSEKWNSFKQWLSDLWQGTKEVLAKIWDGFIYIVSFKWLVDFGKWIWGKLVEFGLWIWNKLLEFGQYLYDKFLAPILDPIFEFYYLKIEPAIRPFIDSIKDLIGRIKSIWAKFKWDENKSFFENLKCLASIVKDAVLDWWNTSPFKTFYETYLDPIIKSVLDLIGRIKSIWQNFNWDENKSFLDNLMTFWDLIKSAIIDWWNGSIIKTYYDKLVEFLSNMIKPIVDWYNLSELKKWIDKIVISVADIGGKVKNWIMEKLSSFSIPIPNGVKIDWKPIGKVPIWGKEISFPMPTFQWKDWKPFGGLAPKVNTEVNASTPSMNSQSRQNDKTENLAEPLQLQADQAKDLAQLQVQGAMQPVNSINNMNQDTNVELQKTGLEMSLKAAEAQAATDDFRQLQSMVGSLSLSRFDDLEKKLDKYGNDPAVVPLPVPYGPLRNAAMMEDN